MPSYIDRLQDIANNRLLTELREKIIGGFPTNLRLLQWLQSEAVKPFTDELETDFLEDHPDHDEANFNTVAHHVDTYNKHPALLGRYTDASPDKTSWSEFDHITRMLVQLIKYDKEHEGPCGWEQKDAEVATSEAYDVYVLILVIFKNFYEAQ